MKSPIIFRVFKDDQIQFVKQFIEKDQVVVGRAEVNQNDIDIDLQSPDVSPIHCLIERRGLNYYLCDLGSIQGTYKNAQQVLDEALESGDEFHVGQFKIVFFVGIPKPVHTDRASEIVISAPKSVAPPPLTAAPIVETKPPIQPAIVVTKPPVQQPTEATQIKPIPASTAPVTPPPAKAPLQKKEEASSKIVQNEPRQSVQNEPKQPVQQEQQRKPAQHEQRPAKGTVSGVALQAEAKPEIQSQYKAQKPSPRAQQFLKTRKGKGAKTFAPPSHHQTVFQAVRPGQGGQIEVLVAWNERIISTHHFLPGTTVTAGRSGNVQIPVGTVVKPINLIEARNGQVFVQLPIEAKCYVQKSDDRHDLKEATHRLQQNEVVFISFSNGIHLAIRFAPKTIIAPLDSPLIFSSSEFTGILAALIIAVLTSLIVSVMSPKMKDAEEDVQRIAQVIFEKPPMQVAVVKPPVPPIEQPVPPAPEPPPKPPELPKKIVESEVPQKNILKGDPKKEETKDQKAMKNASRAQDIRAKDDQNRKKMFTSSKSGGSVKTGPVAGANMKSKEPDVSNTGLLSAFGSGGVRQKLDKAYSGSGELLGAGEKATGSSGFNESRPGEDLGSRFKDTGAGGKGTATQGIAGIGTKSGRGTGAGNFGEGSGFGTKEQTEIAVGGAEEEFVGTIDREAVRRAVRSQLNFFKACYEREYKKNTRLEGKVVIAWEIHEGGNARNARVVRDKTTINNRVVEECVRSRMLTIRFPEPPPGTVAEVAGYPFVFSGLR